MSLFRMAVIAGVAILLLPTDRDQQHQLAAIAADKLGWAMTFCEREPAACTRAGEAWDVFVEKAKFGASLLTELATGDRPVEVAGGRQDAREASFWDGGSARDLETGSYAGGTGEGDGTLLDARGCPLVPRVRSSAGYGMPDGFDPAAEAYGEPVGPDGTSG
ncbi:MAG: DUF5330 domain-containing protein [Hyphomicrobiaceae bacterium]